MMYRGFLNDFYRAYWSWAVQEARRQANSTKEWNR